MVDKTDNHGLNKYNPGDTDWTHSPDMQHIEERLVVRDAEASLSNYTPHPKATFIATDTGSVYDGDGNSWNRATRKFESADIESVSIEEGPSRIFNASPGQMQDKLAQASWGDTVRLDAGRQYDPGSETTVPSGVTLDFSGAEFHPTIAYDGFYVAPFGHIFNGSADVSDVNYTGQRVVKLNGERADENYLEQRGRGTRVQMAAQSANQQGTGLFMKTTESPGYIAIGTRIEFYAREFGTGIHGKVDGGFLNFNQMTVGLTRCGTMIRHTSGSNGTGPFQTWIEGFCQPPVDGVSKIGIHNETDEDSIYFDGGFWDSHNYTQNAIVGPNVDLFVDIPAGADSLEGNTDGSNNVNAFSVRNGDIELFEAGSGVLKLIHTKGHFRLDLPSDRNLQVWPSGTLQLPNTLFVQDNPIRFKNGNGTTMDIDTDLHGMIFEDASGAKQYLGLRSSPPHPPNGSSDTYQDDGANTSSGNPSWRVDDPLDSTWKDMS